MGTNIRHGFLEFFAGGGMARLGLGSNWQCLMANEWSEKKANAYKANFKPCPELVVDDVANLRTSQIPTGAALAWASFPCQDLSLAGNGHGLRGKRSGSFWPFWKIITNLKQEKRQIPIIVIENVTGALISNKGKDFIELANALTKNDYSFGPLVINASSFLPQSRPRLFILAVSKDVNIPDGIRLNIPSDSWHTKQIIRAYNSIGTSLQERWIWWCMPTPYFRKQTLIDIVENNPSDVPWHSTSETERLLNMMTKTNFKKVESAQKSKKKTVGTLYKRTRKDKNGCSSQRAEVRFDQISGCLRTPVGGSSRQIIMVVEKGEIKTRLMSAREAARLMGLDDSYILPDKYNEAYHLVGDGLAVPAVSWLEEHLISPLAAQASLRKAA